MNCRRPTVLAAAAAAVVALAARPTPAPADSIAATSSSSGSDTLTGKVGFNQDIPVPAAGSTGPQVIYSFPSGSIVPPTVNGQQESPLTITSSSTGLDTDHLVVATKDSTDSGGNPVQLLGLSFFNNGLKSLSNGGELDFQLNVSPQFAAAFAGNPGIVQLVQAPASVVPAEQVFSLLPAVTSTTPPGTTTTGTTTPPTTTAPETTPSVPLVNNPEPVSLALWSALTAAGLYRARAFRRRKPG